MKNISALGARRGAAQVIAAWRSLWLCVTLIALALQGCANISSTVKTIRPIGGSDPVVTDSTTGAFVGELNRPITFEVSGTGICNRMFINYGDGTAPVEYTNVDLASLPTFTHTYTGWTGPKTVWAYGNLTDGCGGDARKPIRVGKLVQILGYAQPVPTACVPYPNMPPLRQNTTVKISAVTGISLTTIDFGCVGGCWNNLDGVKDTVAGPNYPFPGLRERSLVIRVGTQVVQGDQSSLSFIFTTTGAGPLEICINDYKLDDNSGAWGLEISVDESAAY